MALKILVHVYLIETKAVRFSAFPALSYLTSIMSATLIRSTSRIRRWPGIRMLWMRSIHREASVSLIQQSVTPTAWIRPYTSIRVYCKVQPVGETVHTGCQSQLLAIYHQASFIKSGVQSPESRVPFVNYAAWGMSLPETFNS